MVEDQHVDNQLGSVSAIKLNISMNIGLHIVRQEVALDIPTQNASVIYILIHSDPMVITIISLPFKSIFEI